MADATPRPYGDLTRRWTHLTPPDRTAQARRLLQGGCRAPDSTHVGDPGLDAGGCYRQLIVAARAGDEVAWAWLAVTHRPTLLRHGRWLIDDDPGEWGVVAFDVLVGVVSRADPEVGRWLRRRTAGRLVRQMTLVRRRLQRRHDREVVLAPSVLARFDHPFEPAPRDWDLLATIRTAVAEFDPATRHALAAVADGCPLGDVAKVHGLTYRTLHQRLTRARTQLRPRLAAHVQAATS